MLRPGAETAAQRPRRDGRGCVVFGANVDECQLIYFFHFAALVFVWPFMPLFLMRHTTTLRLGMLMASSRVVQVVAAPVWTYLADARFGRGPVFGVAFVALQATNVLLPFAAPRVPFGALFALIMFRAIVECPVMALIDSGVLEVLEQRGGVFGRSRLWGSIAWGGLAPLAGIIYSKFGYSYNTALSLVFAVATARCAARVVPRRRRKTTSYEAVSDNPFSIIDDEDDDNPFSIIDAEDDDDDAIEKRDAPTAPAPAVKSAPTVNPLSRVKLVLNKALNPFDRSKEPEASGGAAEHTQNWLARPAASRPAPAMKKESVAFFFCVFVTGSGFGFVMNFLFVFAKSLGGSPLLCGLMLFVECAVEVPFLVHADALLQKYGAKTLLVVVQFLYAVRLLGYAAVGLAKARPWALLLVEPLHGITFALFYTSGVTVAKQLIGPEWATLAQGVFGACFTAGNGAGSAAGAWAVSRYGFERTFLGFAALFCFSTLAFAAALPGHDAKPSDPSLRANAAAAKRNQASPRSVAERLSPLAAVAPPAAPRSWDDEDGALRDSGDWDDLDARVDHLDLARR
ncbi:major facilitator superfamily domain-containing protein [Pelagophyceae sp. CCMP2097]|nr:major facilitator superfamily domain-containing protein [Pelagophyceae sp. CCMP2097]